MNYQSNINRVEIDLKLWQSREERLSKLFSESPSVNNSLLKEKLLYYDNIALKYKNTESTEELSALRLLKNERERIVKELYPNFLVQLLRKTMYVLIIEKITARKNVKVKERNNQFLQYQLKKNGFHDVFNKIEPALMQNQMKFTFPVSHYINEKEKIEFELNFEKSDKDAILLTGYKTTLSNELNPDLKQNHYFKTDGLEGFTAKHAYNLLSGRAVEKDGVWIKFDLNDKDASGNYRLKEFNSDFGYDLQKEIKALPLKEINTDNETIKLLDGLKNGSLEPVVFFHEKKECKCYIEANPQFKSINVFDANLKKTSLESVLGLRINKIAKTQVNNIEKSKIDVAQKRGVKI